MATETVPNLASVSEETMMNNPLIKINSMNTKHISFAFAAAAALVAGCAKSPIEEVKPSEQLTDLELSRVGAIESKAAIDGTDFPQTGEIGLFLFKDELAETSYGESGYSNVKYAYNSSKSKWTASPSIKVGSDPGYLFGYYPYSSTATDVKEIPVESSLNGDDVMYATKQTVNDKTASQTAITMNHALARVSIKVINNGYTGKSELSKIKFSGTKIAPEGTLNALDGKITATNSDVTLDVPTANQTITATGSTYECLLVPSGEDDNKQTVTLTLTIDGEDKTATLSGDNGVIIAQGTKSNITITLSNKGISVSSVSIDEWKEVEIGGHKVTVKFDESVVPNDILTDIHIEGQSVIIKATSIQKSFLSCNVGDDARCQRVIDNDIFTFTISDISSNVEAVLSYSIVTISVSSDSNGKAWIGDDESKTSGKFYEGQQVVIHAAPNDKFRLYRWNDNNRETSRTITVSELEPTYSASFISTDLIPGLFTVSNGKQVFFSKGNLYCSGVIFNDDGTVKSMENAQWGFEANQYDTTPSYDGNRVENHISHFMWSSTAEQAIALQYGPFWYGKTFFAEKDFTVNGVSTWRTLTGGDNGEWKYLINKDNECGQTIRSGKYRNDVDVCGSISCLILLPDDWKWGENGVGKGWLSEYSESTTVKWSTMENAGAVCLRAAGYRDGAEGTAYVHSVGWHGSYWSSTPSYYYDAYRLYFNPDYIYQANNIDWYCAFAVRLVTEYQSEPSAE